MLLLYCWTGRGGYLVSVPPIIIPKQAVSLFMSCAYTFKDKQILFRIPQNEKLFLILLLVSLWVPTACYSPSCALIPPSHYHHHHHHSSSILYPTPSVE